MELCCIFLVIWTAYILKNEIYLLINTIVVLLFFFKVWLWFLYFSVPFFIIPPYPHLSLHRVGILLPPSLLGRAPSRGSHGLSRRTADRVSLCLSLLSCSASLSWYFPAAWSVLPQPLLPFESDLQACAKGALPGLSSQLTLPLHVNRLPLRALGKLSEVNVILKLLNLLPVTVDLLTCICL